MSSACGCPGRPRPEAVSAAAPGHVVGAGCHTTRSGPWGRTSRSKGVLPPMVRRRGRR
jgi:hypothetical protein